MNRSEQLPNVQASIIQTPLDAGCLDLSSTRTVGVEYIMARMKLLLASALYIVVLLWAYVTIVSPAFAYDGFTCTWPDAPAMILVMILTLLPCFFLPYGLSRPSALVLWWLYIAAYIPSVLVPALTLHISFEHLLTLQISLLLCMALLSWGASARLLDLARVSLAPNLYWPAFWLVWIVSLGYYIGLSGGVSKLAGNFVSLFNGASEYTLRSQFNNLVEGSGRILGYLPGELGGALNPFLIAYGLLYRRRWCLLAGIVGQIVVFGFTGLKGILFSSLYLALMAALATDFRKTFGLALIFALTAIVFVCTVTDRATHSILFSSVFTRRTVLVPGLLTGFYFEHFSQTGPVGIGLHFSHDPAVLTPPNEIGFVYFHHADTNANANLWAEGFAELGLPGMFAFTLFTAFLIWLYDSLAAKRDLVMALLLAAMPALSVSNTSPTTTLVTWGGLVAGLLLFFSPSPVLSASTETAD
jgi:hypothetical protein